MSTIKQNEIGDKNNQYDKVMMIMASEIRSLQDR